VRMSSTKPEVHAITGDRAKATCTKIGEISLIFFYFSRWQLPNLCVHVVGAKYEQQKLSKSHLNVNMVLSNITLLWFLLFFICLH